MLFFQTESPSKTSVFINGEYFEFGSGLPQNPDNVILNISKFELIFINALFSYSNDLENNKGLESEKSIFFNIGTAR